VSRARELLDETQGELLSVIFDCAAALIDWPIHEHFGSVTGGEFSP
jgi:hypothetical protein